MLCLAEPTADPDPAATRVVVERIPAVAASGTGIVTATYDVRQAPRQAGEISLLHHTGC